jgi:hypothetical protein
MDAFMEEDVPREPPPAAPPAGFRAWHVSHRHGEIVVDLDRGPSSEDWVWPTHSVVFRGVISRVPVILTHFRYGKERTLQPATKEPAVQFLPERVQVGERSSLLGLELIEVVLERPGGVG